MARIPAIKQLDANAHISVPMALRDGTLGLTPQAKNAALRGCRYDVLPSIDFVLVLPFEIS